MKKITFSKIKIDGWKSKDGYFEWIILKKDGEYCFFRNFITGYTSTLKEAKEKIAGKINEELD